MVSDISNRINLRKVWQGNKSLKKGFRHLFWTFVRFVLSRWLWNTAVRLVPMLEPYQKVGIALAFISLVFFVWGILGLWLTLRESGLRGLGIIFSTFFLLLFIFNLLTFPEPDSIQKRLLPTLTKSGLQSWNLITKIGESLMKAPEDFRFAYTGSDAGNYIPGFPTPDPSVKPLIVEALPAEKEILQELRLGGYAIINTQNGEDLGCRSEPDLALPSSVKFSVNERMLILDGPQNDESGKNNWWRLHGPQGEGYCLEEFLEPAQ